MCGNEMGCPLVLNRMFLSLFLNGVFLVFFLFLKVSIVFVNDFVSLERPPCTLNFLRKQIVVNTIMVMRVD
jgi:hypothetical protein